MKVFLDMVGCRLNQSELESYACQFRLAGHSLTANASEADLVVINTCTVTAAADSDSRQKIRQAAREGVGQIIATGCWATLNQAEALTLPGVAQVVGNHEKDTLVPKVLHLPENAFDHRSIQRQPIPGVRLRTRAFIKVQDGCDNHCTFCVTTLARGAGRSRPIQAVLEDVMAVLEGGAQEVVLTGVHLGSWGYDFTPPAHLSALIQAILSETEIPRLRLSSLEPWDISPEFLALWHNQRLCRHLHLPVQSGCAATLKRMGRNISPQTYSDLVQQVRATIPGVTITTDVITGFPGETEAEFTESAAFIEAMAFANGHVFTYSARPGTAAAHLPNPVPSGVAKTRNAIMRKIFSQGASTFLASQLWQELIVLWEKATPVDDRHWQLRGLSDNYMHVSAFSHTPCLNQIMRVRAIGVEGGELVGEIRAA